MGAYTSLSSEISRRALICAWALKVMNTVRKFTGTNCQITSQGHNLYKLRNVSLEPVKIADYFKENNLFTLCLKIVSSRSNLQSLRI